ncbi:MULTISPECIES: efflux RND transporter periplasmic adaptor subunit [Stutzerimonas]|uniref:efflux RND transporter periplasmic adaptor subunit n=1 Tax=Stutzerimonas TaxID=2901164 RepID=UPI00042533F4|nr:MULTISPECIES: efflux RND transporter periplasmic adaptor subunit [Stutzerimonas]
MKRSMILGAGTFALATAIAGFAGGYLMAQKPTSSETVDSSAPQERKVLYYRNPMGLADTSPVPKKDPMGMDYIPVYADEAPTVAQGERKVLYYRNPMGLPDTSPVPKKDSMGMDYIAVYEGEESGSTVTISPEKIQLLGVLTSPVERRVLTRTVRAVGTVQVDERGQYTLAPKFDGWIEKLHVNTTGEPVRKGQPLIDVYSPELVSAQQEFLIANAGRQRLAGGSANARQGVASLAESAMQRLRNWDIGEAQLERLRRTGKTSRTLTITAPVDGVVLEKTALEGMRFQAGDALYRIADLDTVWLIAEVFEQDLALIRLGQAVQLSVSAYPDRRFTGEVSFIYPDLSPQTRTVRVRIELPNPDGLLKPAMFGTAQLAAGERAPVLALPDSAVIDSGTRRVALVALGEGRFEPRELLTGRRADGFLEVLEGLGEGESVVTRANFLIDAESNLKAALSGMSTKSAPAAAHDHGEHAGPGHTATPTDAAAHSAHAAHAGHTVPIESSTDDHAGSHGSSEADASPSDGEDHENHATPDAHSGHVMPDSHGNSHGGH